MSKDSWRTVVVAKEVYQYHSGYGVSSELIEREDSRIRMDLDCDGFGGLFFIFLDVQGSPQPTKNRIRRKGSVDLREHRYIG